MRAELELSCVKKLKYHMKTTKICVVVVVVVVAVVVADVVVNVAAAQGL